MKFRWYMKHKGEIKRVINWVTVSFDDGNKMHRITLDDFSFHNSCNDDFYLTEPSVAELLEYRKRINSNKK